MQSILKWLRALGPLGEFAANALSFITANWALVVSILIALWTASFDQAVAFVHNPTVQTAVIVFMTLLWTYIGISFLIDRRRPRLIKVEQDYSYALVVESVAPNYTPHIKEGVLSFSLNLRNFSNGPIMYQLEKFEILIGTRTLGKGTYSKQYLPRGGGRAAWTKAFKDTDIQEFRDGEIHVGNCEFSVIYGHPDRKPERRLRMTLKMHLKFESTGPIGFGDDIVEENDEPIKGT